MPNNNVIGHVILEGLDMEPNIKVLDKGKRNGKVVGFAIFQEAEKENRNGRSYLTKDLAREVACPRTKELLKTNTFYSEWCHPAGDMVRQQTIDPKCSVARILSLEMNGNFVQGTFTPTNTPLGLAYNEEILEGVIPAWSLRALGSLENVGGRMIVTNLKMVTYDSVVYPSHDAAYTQKILSESAVTTVEDSYSRLKRIANEQAGIKTSFRESGELVPIMNKQIMDYVKQESGNVRKILEQVDIFYESAKMTDKNHVQLVGKNGDVFIINLESYVQREIENYCLNQ